MKTMLKKILLISLLFSVTVPSSTVQANSLDKIVVGVGVAVGTAFVWKMRKIILNYNLWSAIGSNNIEGVKRALANGADVNKGELFSWGEGVFTPLMFAASGGCYKGGNSKIVELLLATNKVEINQHDGDGWTALMDAAMCEKTSRDLEEKQKFRNIIGQLLAAGADPLIRVKSFWLSKNGGFELTTRTDGTTLLEQGSNETKETIRKFLAQKREQTSRILKEVVAEEPISLELSNDPANVISEYAYSVPECEPVQ